MTHNDSNQPDAGPAQQNEANPLRESSFHPAALCTGYINMSVCGFNHLKQMTHYDHMRVFWQQRGFGGIIRIEE